MGKEEMEGMSKEDIDKIKAELEQAKQDSVSKETQDAIAKAKEEARKEVEKEMAINAELKAKQDEILKLKEEQIRKEKEAAEKLDALTKKIDDMVTSKAIVTPPKDPFKQSDSKINVDALSDDEIKDIEEDSARAFFGEENYEHLKRFKENNLN